MLTLQLEAQNFESADLSSLRHVITGAAPVPTALAERVIDSMGVRLTNSYGATETGGLVTYIPADAPAMAATETCGVAMPGYELRAVDAERHEVAPGEVGELAVRGPSVMAGYHDAPEQTAATLDDEGWWYSGDLATLDGDGYLRIVGRQKDMYIRGGYNVYPAEVEAVLEKHEAVVSAAVVAYADPVLGERGRAFLVTRGGACDADEVRKHCRDHPGRLQDSRRCAVRRRAAADRPRQGRSSGTCGAGRNAMSTRPPQRSTCAGDRHPRPPR